MGLFGRFLGLFGLGAALAAQAPEPELRFGRRARGHRGATKTPMPIKKARNRRRNKEARAARRRNRQ